MDILKIYNQHSDGIKKFILSMVKNEWVADDLVQETFIRVKKNMANLKDQEKIKTWIFRIAYNLCQDHFRSQNRVATREVEDCEALKSFKLTMIQKRLEQQQMGACIQDKMTLLPESLKTVLVLYDVLEFKQREISEIMDISVENVKVRLHRARKRLKIILEDACNFERDERDVLVCLPKEKG